MAFVLENPFNVLCNVPLSEAFNFHLSLMPHHMQLLTDHNTSNFVFFLDPLHVVNKSWVPYNGPVSVVVETFPMRSVCGLSWTYLPHDVAISLSFVPLSPERR